MEEDEDLTQAPRDDLITMIINKNTRISRLDSANATKMKVIDDQAAVINSLQNDLSDEREHSRISDAKAKALVDNLQSEITDKATRIDDLIKINNNVQRTLNATGNNLQDARERLAKIGKLYSELLADHSELKRRINWRDSPENPFKKFFDPDAHMIVNQGVHAPVTGSDHSIKSTTDSRILDDLKQRVEKLESVIYPMIHDAYTNLYKRPPIGDDK